MSVLIKSNNVLQSNGFGQVKMLGTTAQAQFDAYKARVLADGGVIKDETRTLSAFNLLFNNKMYGNMNTAVSGTFGVKTDANGGLTKLYAIDGVDLIGVTYGTGTLPRLDANNNIVFANNAAQNINGGMFTTESKLVTSKIGNFGVLSFVKSYDNANASRIFGITKHSDVSNTNLIASVIVGGTDITMSVQSDPLKLTGTATNITGRTNISGSGYPPVSCLIDATNALIALSRNNVEIATAAGKTFTAITTEDFYIDFGGTYHSDKKYFANATVRDMFCFAHATRGQATAISAFS